MNHIIVKIITVAVPSLYKIHVVFSDHSEQTIDLEPILFGPVYGPLRDASLFRSVAVDDETGTIVWPNGADFDPATLYRWELVKKELAERAIEWKGADSDAKNVND